MDIHSKREAPRQRAKRAAQWLAAYGDCNPSAALAGRMFDTNVPAIRKAAKALNGNGSNGNGNGHASLPTFDDAVHWWQTASDADRAAFVKLAGVSGVWRAIEANL
jgi:hypothetical protein